MILALGCLVACRSPSTPSAPSEAERYLTSGCERMNAGNPGEALPDLDRAIQLAPRWAEARRQRAHCRVLLGDHPGVLEDLKVALTLEPNDPWSHYARGVSLWATVNRGEAIESFTRALALDPGHFKSAQHRAHGYMVLGDYERAVADLELALRITPAGDPDVDWIQESLVQARAAAEERRR
jgi:tetratricopeptide (TPR) repeat protein